VIITRLPNGGAELAGVEGLSIESELVSIPVVTASIDQQGLANLQKIAGIQSVILDQNYRIP